MTAAFRASQLVRYYPAVRSDPIRAVDGVDWEIPAGRLAVLTGPSGSGKTTLLGLIAGLDRPHAGQLELLGTPLAGLSDAALALLRRRRVGLVFQDFQLLADLTCWENVALPLVPTGATATVRRRVAGDLLTRLGVGQAADRPARQLSGGQQQRVALARALVNDPDLVLADEPTSQIDAESAKIVWRLLESLVALGKTVVVATHEVDLVRPGSWQFRMTAGRLERVA